MKTKVAILFGAVVLIVGGVIFAVAQGGAGMHPPGLPVPFGVPDIDHLTKALNLTDAQANELKPFLDSERATIEALNKRLEDTHQQLEAATKDGKFDEAQVRTLAGQHAQAMADLIVEHERLKAKLYNLLTPDQRAKAEQMHRMGPHHRGPGGLDGSGGPPPPPAPPTPEP